ncbi:hypothetical protein [Sorangium sp. So ce854]|uniref:hypothetical protein n=1 Tax=Sorangium sp. So ce854 TaxID=3133322 RepID=UPI003F5E7CE2
MPDPGALLTGAPATIAAAGEARKAALQESFEQRFKERYRQRFEESLKERQLQTRIRQLAKNLGPPLVEA